MTSTNPNNNSKNDTVVPNKKPDNTHNTEKSDKDKKYVDKPLITNYSIIMPYINEISNLLTITLFKPYFNFELYPHSTNTIIQIIKKKHNRFICIIRYCY